MKIKKWNVFRLIWFSIVILFFIWQWSTYQARSLPKNTFSESDKVSVTESSDKISFSSKNTNNKSEIIFFQGGLTDPEAYAPLCRMIAENGFTCHLIKMDWRMPQWNYKNIKGLFNLREGQLHNRGAFTRSKNGGSVCLRKP